MLVQLSDPHLQVGPRDGESARALAVAVEAVAALDPAPEAVVVSGDIAEHGAPAEYERATELLAPLSMPVHAMAGNHDDRDALRAAFGGTDDDFVHIWCCDEDTALCGTDLTNGTHEIVGCSSAMNHS